MNRQIITGIDIGTSSIRVAVCEVDKDTREPHILALVRKTSRGLKKGYIANLEEAVEAVGEALREAERMAKTRIRRVYVGLGGLTLESRAADGAAVVSRADLEITLGDIKRAVEEAEANLPDMANRQVLHRIPVACKLDGKKVLGQATGMKGGKLEVRTIFITYSKQHLKDFVTALEENGIIVEDIIAAPLAASVVSLTKLERASGCVLANIGAHTTSIVVFDESVPLSLQVFPVGSSDITNDIALGFKITLEEAERIKKRESEPEGTRKKLEEIIQARVSDIFDYIELHLKKNNRNGLLPAGIILGGGGAGTAGMEDLARDYLKLPAHLALPLRLSTGRDNQTIDPAWAVAYGLTIYQNEYEALDKKTSTRATSLGDIWRWLKEFMP